jgi:hypothetical protein
MKLWCILFLCLVGLAKAANPFDIQPSPNPNATLYWTKLPEGGVFLAVRDNPSSKIPTPMLILTGNGVIVQKMRIRIDTESVIGDIMNRYDRLRLKCHLIQ